MWVVGCLWVSPSKVHGLEGGSENAENGGLDAYATDFYGEGDLDILDLSWGPVLHDHAAILAKYYQPWEECSTANVLLPTFVVDFICLAVQSVRALSDRSVTDTQFGVLDATWPTYKGRVSTLELEIASKDAENVAKLTQGYSLQERLGIA